MASQNKKFQAFFSTMRWFDAQGGHLENKGISPDGKVIDVPLHRHHVNLNIYRTDIGLKYNFRTGWSLEVNVPYEVKVQEADIEEIEKVSEAEMQAILRNRDNHHRNETYTGPTDPDLFIGHYRLGVLTEGDFVMGRIGTTIPLGKTEEDPWILGDAGKEHLHIQFGTGTFNPIADLHYSLPLYKGLATHASVRVKYPFYVNNKTYRGSRELTYTAGLNFRPNKWVTFQAGYLGFYQSYAQWAGEIDINTGLTFSMASCGVSVTTPFNVPLSLALMWPLHQETLYDDSSAFVGGQYEESDAFEFGPLISLTAIYSF